MSSFTVWEAALVSVASVTGGVVGMAAALVTGLDGPAGIGMAVVTGGVVAAVIVVVGVGLGA
jgi:hypothetical protein